MILLQLILAAIDLAGCPKAAKAELPGSPAGQQRDEETFDANRRVTMREHADEEKGEKDMVRKREPVQVLATAASCGPMR